MIKKRMQRANGEPQIVYLMTEEDLLGFQNTISELQDAIHDQEERILRKVNQITEMKVRKYAERGSLDQNTIVLARNPEMVVQTKILLKRYRKIKESIDKTLLERCRREKVYYESFEWFDAMMRNKDPDMIMGNAIESSYRTAVLLCRLEYAIERYKKLSVMADKYAVARCDALCAVYIADEKMNIKEIGESQNLKKSQIYRYIGVAIEELAALLFPDEEKGSQTDEE